MAQVYHKTISAMGTRLDVVIPNIDNMFGDNLLAIVEQEVYRVEYMLSYFREESIVSEINATGHLAPYVISEELYSLFIRLREYSYLTNGAFDIVKAVRKYGCDTSGLSMDSLVFNEINSSISLPEARCRIDLGAVGKGYALERVEQLLRRAGVADALLSFGDSSIVAMGSHPMGDCWKIAMRSRVDTQKTLYTFSLKDSSLSTSGNLIFCDDNSTKSIKHIVDPNSDSIIDKSELVSVVASSAVEAEVLSTALYIVSENTEAIVGEQSRIADAVRFTISPKGEEICIKLK